MNKNPFEVITPGQARSLENSPTVEAMQHGLNVVPDTWGSYATRAVEMGLCEPEIEKVLDFFCITWEELNDPFVYFDDRSYLTQRFYYDKFFKTRTSKYSEPFNPEVDRITGIADQVISKWSATSDEDKKRATDEADKIQLEINKSLPGNLDGGLEPSLDDMQIELLCLKRDGLYDGLNVTLAEFVTEMLAVDTTVQNGQEGPLAGLWVKGLKNVIKSVIDNHSYADISDVPASEIYLDKGQVDELVYSIKSGVADMAEDLAKSDWELVRRVLATPSTHPLIENHNSYLQLLQDTRSAR